MRRTWVALALLLPAALFAHGIAGGQGRSNGRSEAAGFDSERLDRLRAVMQRYVDRGELAGMVMLVARNGRIALHAPLGKQDREAGKAMRRECLFRIASMSKPVTSVAAMLLYEEGRFLLNDPISRYLPKFANARVLKPGAVTSAARGGSNPETVPAERAITVRDLLTHRSGLVYGIFDQGPVGEAYRKAGISEGLSGETGTIAETIDRLAMLPLQAQPGKSWLYGMSTDVLGRLVEVVSGQTLEQFLRERIFKPLRMNDTSFAVSEGAWPRFATQYTVAEGGGIRPMKDPEQVSGIKMAPNASYRTPKTYFAGGAGLVSTAQDYARFAQMLLNGGELDGVRLLSRKTVELMTTSHTSDLERPLGAGTAFGLGFGIVTDVGATQQSGSVGSYNWGGIYGTSFWVDPKEKLVGVLMAQQFPSAVPHGTMFQAMSYQAIGD